MSTDIAKVVLEADSGPLNRAGADVDKFGNRVEKAGKRTAVASAAIKRQFAAMAAGVVGFVAATAGISGSIRTIVNYERATAKLAGITRANTQELAAMEKVAKQLGSTTEFSASQAVEGLTFLGMAGFSAAEGVAAIPAVLDLATAASMDLGRAADISSNIMSAFGIAASDAGAVADVLAAASSRANTDVGQLGEAMKFVGPVASAMGVSMNDAAAAIGVLSDAGIQGGSAGTGLRRILSGLANATPEATKVIKGLGIEMKDLDPTTNSLVDVVQRLADAGLDASDALTIFGDRGGPAILALTSQVDNLRDLTGELGNVEGQAAQMAATLRDNLGGDIDSLVSSLEGLVLALGDAGLTAALRAAVQGVTEVVRALTSFVEWVSQSDAALNLIEGTVYAFGGYLAVTMVPAIWAAVTAVGGLSGAFILLRGAIASTGFGALLIGAGYLVAWFLDLVDSAGGFGNALKQLRVIAGVVMERIGLAFQGLWEGIQGVYSLIVSGFKVAMAELIDIANASVQTLVDAFNPLERVRDKVLESVNVDRLDPTGGRAGRQGGSPEELRLRRRSLEELYQMEEPPTIIPEVDTAPAEEGLRSFEDSSLQMMREFQSALTGILGTAGTDGGQALTGGLQTEQPATVAVAQATADGIEQVVAGLDLESYGAEAIRGLTRGMESQAGTARAAAASIASQVLTEMRTTLRISSPSRETEEVGRQAANGFWLGLTQASESLRASAEQDAAEAVRHFEEAGNLIAQATAPIRIAGPGTFGDMAEAGPLGAVPASVIRAQEQVAALNAELENLDQGLGRVANTNNALAGSLQDGAQAANAEARALRGTRDATEELSDAQQFFNQQRQNFEQGIVRAIVRGESLTDVMLNLAQAIAEAALQALLFGSGPLGGSGGGGLLGGLMSGIFGGLGGAFARGAAFAPGGGGAPRLQPFAMGAALAPANINQAPGDGLTGARVIPFARGGALVTQPTVFPMAGAKMGLMAEKGPEAIMPLQRGSDGKLGVGSAGGSSPVVNIENNVKNVNVLDMKEVEQHLSTSAEFEQLVVNIMSRNSGAA